MEKSGMCNFHILIGGEIFQPEFRISYLSKLIYNCHVAINLQNTIFFSREGGITIKIACYCLLHRVRWSWKRQ